MCANLVRISAIFHSILPAPPWILFNSLFRLHNTKIQTILHTYIYSKALFTLFYTFDCTYVHPVLTYEYFKIRLKTFENFITYTTRCGRKIPPLDTVNGQFYHFQIFNSTLFYDTNIEVHYSSCHFHNISRITLHDSLLCSPCYTLSRDIACSSQNSLFLTIAVLLFILYC